MKIFTTNLKAYFLDIFIHHTHELIKLSNSFHQYFCVGNNFYHKHSALKHIPPSCML